VTTDEADMEIRFARPAGVVAPTCLGGPGDGDDETPIGDPPDDDGGDWDDEDDDEDDDDDEDPLQASMILQRSIAMHQASRHNGVRLTG